MRPLILALASQLSNCCDDDFMNFNMFVVVCILLAVQPRGLARTDDYWDENFDEDKNCEAEDEIEKLLNQPKPTRCAVTRHGKSSIIIMITD